jgi:hypothetical protein
MLGGLFPTGPGPFELLAPDAASRLQAWGHRTRGVRAERTPEWDSWRRIGGVLLIVGGVALLAIGVRNP